MYDMCPRAIYQRENLAETRELKVLNERLRPRHKCFMDSHYFKSYLSARSAVLETVSIIEVAGAYTWMALSFSNRRYELQLRRMVEWTNMFLTQNTACTIRRQ